VHDSNYRENIQRIICFYVRIAGRGCYGLVCVVSTKLNEFTEEADQEQVSLAQTSPGQKSTEYVAGRYNIPYAHMPLESHAW